MIFLHGSTIRLRKLLFGFAALSFLIPAAVSAQTVTAPSGGVAVPTSRDFFSTAFQDAADMKDRTDVGWFAYGIDQPRANLNPILVANGVFTARASSGDPNIYLLEHGQPRQRGARPPWRRAAHQRKHVSHAGDPHAPQRRAGGAGV